MAALGRSPGSSTDSDGKVYGLLHFRPGTFHMTACLDREGRPATTATPLSLLSWV